ncbi:hypothetical protein SAMN05446037_10077 [Anaerovirgula multivorans]|uniref:Leucine Rich repeat-containing protein n=1 Tax=Anaerovirgula multivorans TaxID=312168 RepID=A0A239D7H9_9FIRM|nr:leucine-rich repeat domain-containing protein [Anaerovirgula multivorans]SNS27533.1 hypothetical protein SAMN05446037_10077 [Anaerovirgula multivorans]
MGKPRNYQKDAYWGLGYLFILMILYIRGINAFPDGGFPAIWIGSTIGVSLGCLIRKDNLKELEFMAVPILMLVNYMLFRNSIYMPNYIVLYVGITGLVIYYFYKVPSSWRLYKIMAVILLLIGFLALDYHTYSNRIIKDRNFDRYVKKEFDIGGSITEADLWDIEELFLSERDNIVSLEGIHHFKNLRKLHLWGGNIITDFSPLGDLNNLERLMTWYMDMDKLIETGEMTSLEELELLYPKRGKITGLENFPNLKSFRIQGKSFEDLRGLQGPEDLELLFIGAGQVISFEGIEAFPNLRELGLFNLNVTDISEIFDLEKLEKIQFEGGRIHNPKQFEEMVEERGIYLKKIKTLEEQIREEINETAHQKQKSPKLK